jgi:hypothetical protein
MATSSSLERRIGALHTWRAVACLALAAVALALAPLGRIAHAAESYDSCSGFVTGAMTIDSPGTWCLTQNLSIASAIYLGADNVTLDCNGFKVEATGDALVSNVPGISGTNRVNLTVRNCHVRGFYHGIEINEASGSPNLRHVVEDNRISNARVRGIYVKGDGSVVRRNLVVNTAGPGAAYGIHTDGDVDVIDNTVSFVASGGAGEAAGIETQRNEGGSLRGNRVRGVRRNGSGAVYGIQNKDASKRMVIRDNVVTSDSGQASTLGLGCDVATDRAKGNAIKGFGTAIVGCSNDGNVIKP